MIKEVTHGWSIPILPSIIKSMPGTSVTPLGVAIHWTVDDEGNTLLKRRTTHDCSFPGPSGKSVNKRVKEDLLEPCLYGHTLLRILHFIHNLRFRYPNEAILIKKR